METTEKKSSTATKTEEYIIEIYNRLTDKRAITRLARKIGKSRRWVYDCFENRWSTKGAMKVYHAAVELLKEMEGEEDKDNKRMEIELESLINQI